MSRPQFQANAQASALPGPVVNGGLIDFQDNFHRGLAEYANYMAVHQQQQQQHVLASGGYPGQQTLPSYPSQLQSTMGFQAPAGPQTQLPCISGPPAYVHINGQTYVPVESPQAVSVSKPSPSAQPAAVEAAPEPQRPLSNEELERRVYEQVEAWASRQRKPTYAPETSSDGGRRHLKGRALSDEDRAAERVNSVNAGMRGRFRSPF
jgi:hypothetical protein